LAIEGSSTFEFDPFLSSFLSSFFSSFFSGCIYDIIHVAVVFEAVLVGVLFGGGEVGDFGGVEEVVEDFFLEGKGAIAQFCQMFEQIEPLVEMGGELGEGFGEFGQFDIDELEFVVEYPAVLILEFDNVKESSVVFMVVEDKV
jgi:hypothetical protein